MPTHAPLSKQLATKAYGGEVILHGESFGEAEDYAKELEKKGYTMIHPYEDEDIIAGQGTIGLEIMGPSASRHNHRSNRRWRVYLGYFHGH
jgi:threonine dehydratase